MGDSRWEVVRCLGTPARPQPSGLNCAAVDPDARLTQEQLAERSGLSVRTVRELERGRVRYPRPESLRLLAEVLGLAGADFAQFEALGRRTFWAERAAAAQERTAVPAQLPADVTPFSGRSGLLYELDGSLPDGDAHAVPIIVLSGGPGVGKTALAVHWGHRVRRLFPDGQLFLNLQGHSASPPLSPWGGSARLLRGLGVEPDRVPPDELEAGALLRSLLADTRTLIVLDDARHVEQVRPLLPGGPGCHVLVTSRTALGGLVAYNGARPFTVSALDLQVPEAVTRLLGANCAAVEPGAVDELARLCGHLPLALRIAAANVLGPDGSASRTSWSGCAAAATGSPSSRCRPTRRRWSEARSRCPTPPCRSRRGGCSGGSRWRRDRLSRPLRPRWCSTPRPMTPAECWSNSPPPTSWSRAPGRYSRPDLLRFYAVEQAAAQDSETQRSAAWERLLRHYQRTLDAAAHRLYPKAVRLPFPSAGGPDPFPDHRSAAAWLDTELPTLQAVILAAAKSGPAQAAWLLADGLRAWFHGRGAVSAWHAVATAALTAAERVGVPSAQAAAHLSISGAWTRQDRYVEAIRHGQLALELAERAGWAERGGRPGCARQPETAYRGAGRGRRTPVRRARPRRPGGSALPTVDHREHRDRPARDGQARRGRRPLHARPRAVVARARRTGATDLGAVLNGMGRPGEALEHLAAALAVHRGSATAWQEGYNLRCQAEVHRDVGRLGSALELAQAALHLAREVDDPRLEAQSQLTVASVHQAAGRQGEASTAFNSALGLASATGNSYTEAQALIGLAVARAASEEAGPALALAQSALRIARRRQHLLLEGQALVAAAEAALMLDRPDVALEHARAAADVHQRTGYVHGRAAAARLVDAIAIVTVTPRNSA